MSDSLVEATPDRREESVDHEVVRKGENVGARERRESEREDP